MTYNLMRVDLGNRPDANFVAVYILMRVNHHLLHNEPMKSDWIGSVCTIDKLLENFEVVRK